VQTFSLILLSALLLAAADSAARTERVRWTHPNSSTVDFFRVYSGPSSRSYTEQVDVSEPAVGSDGVFFVDLEVPDEATVYIAMTAHADGIASLLSNERVRNAASTDPGGSPEPTPEPEPEPDPGDPPPTSSRAAIERFALWDASTSTQIDANFTDGASIDLGTYPCTAIEVIGNAYLSSMFSPGSVRFTFDGDTSGGCSNSGLTHENQPPYAWERELGSNQFACADSLTVPGVHTLAVTPFEEDNCAGAAGPTLRVTFEVVAPGGGSGLGQPGQPQIILD
jgi:hypothetical protein